jgi:hypothetical protein
MELVNKEDYIGKRENWKDLVKLFPNKWIAMSDCTWNRADIVDGVVDGIMTDEEAKEERALYFDISEVCRRTTVGSYGGYIDVRIFENQLIC